jgi:ParB family chromosome partitioning protein
MCFLAQEAQLDDEAAFQLADLENRARKDVSDLERARNYADALDRYYGGHLRGMAQRLGVSPGWLSKTIKIATIPDEIVAAFANPADLQTKPAYALAQAIAEPGRAAHIRSRAEALASEQEVRRARGDGPLRPAEVMRRLIHGSAQQAEPQCQPSCTALGGGTIISIQKQDDDGLLLRLHLGSGVTLEEVVAAFREAILKVKWISGQDLTPGVFPRGNTGGGAAAAEQPTKNSTSSVRRHRSRVGQSEKQIPLF